MPTLSDVAVKAGVSKSTVSMALNNYPSISASTKRRIEQAADEIGYHRDPLSRALSQYRMKGNESFGKIAWIESNRTTIHQDQESVFNEYFQGASQQAKRLGLSLKNLNTSEMGKSSKEINEYLITHKFEGIILASHDRPYSHLNLNWELFYGVRIGHSLSRPQLHLVASHEYFAMLISLRRLRSMGYQRVGLAVKANERNFLAAFLAEQLSWNSHSKIRPSHPKNRNEFKKWLNAYHPDVILTSQPEIFAWLKKIGLKAPKDVGYAVLPLTRRCCSDGISGFDQGSKIIGASAINILVQQFQNNGKGIPVRPNSYLTEGIWVDGYTTARQAH
jgi:LacI family transcriptional regulator